MKNLVQLGIEAASAAKFAKTCSFSEQLRATAERKRAYRVWVEASESATPAERSASCEAHDLELWGDLLVNLQRLG